MTINRRVIIDTDPGIDDAAAILMALGSPELQVEALTTVFGNTPVQQCTVNALTILEAGGRGEIPVYGGAARPLDFAPPEFAAHIHGSDGLGDVGLAAPIAKPADKRAAVELVDRVMSAPGEITVAAIGRLTNVALAISIEPEFANEVYMIVVMGGAVHVPGNVTPVASANLHGDPLAADIVYRSGARIVQVGLDVCDKVEIPLAAQEKVWSNGSQAGELMRKTTPFIKRAYNMRSRLRDPDAVRFNDVPALAYLIDSSLFGCQEMHIEVATVGRLTKGQTIAAGGGTGEDAVNASVALDVEAERLAELWAERVSAL